LSENKGRDQLEDMIRLRRDNERLRGLLASMDDRNEGLYAYGIRFCPWCSWMNDGPGFTQMGMDEHSPKCPAFTPDGAVR